MTLGLESLPVSSVKYATVMMWGVERRWPLHVAAVVLADT